MSGTAQLQATIISNQQSAAAARSRAASLQSQADQIRREIAELEHQLRDMRSFEGTAKRDFADVEAQLAQRRRIVSKIGEIENLAMAKQLCERMSGDCLPKATSMLQRSLSITFDEIQRGKRKLEKRIQELRSQLRGLQNQIAQQYAVARTCDQNAHNASVSLRSLQQSNS